MKTPITLEGKTIFVTGSAGFIGANLVKRLLTVPHVRVIGIDNMNDYYDVSLKEYRLQELEKAAALAEGRKYHFIRGNLVDKDCITDIFDTWHPDIVVNLAAQAGVRYSITNPDVYIESNLIGFYNILEACRHPYDGGAKGVVHLVYASSSSVYGGNTKVPFSTDDKVDHPVSLYAATKKSDELLAHCYSKLYNIPSTGLRFFTPYRFSTTVTAKETSPTSMTLWKALSASCRGHRKRKTAVTDFPFRPMPSTTSAADGRKPSSAS